VIEMESDLESLAARPWEQEAAEGGKTQAAEATPDSAVIGEEKDEVPAEERVIGMNPPSSSPVP
jgi:hypothetical protein